MTVTCPCGQPTAGATLCDRCTHTLDVALANIAVYDTDADTTVRTKQTRYASAGRRAGNTRPMPVDHRFTDRCAGYDADTGETWGEGSSLMADAQNTLTTWARVLLDEQPPLCGPRCHAACLHVSCATISRTRPPWALTASAEMGTTRDGGRGAHVGAQVEACCRYLAANLSRLAAADWAPEILDELCDLEHRLARLVDRPAESWYAGVCGAVTNGAGCTRELYAQPHTPFVRCGDCGTTHDVDTRRSALLAEAEDRHATVRTIARVVTTLGDMRVSEHRITRRIETWVQRNRLWSHGQRVVDGRVRPVYRIGDVLDLLTRDTRDSA